MRFLSAAVPTLMMSLMITTAASAATTPVQWQGQLQSEIERLSANSPDIEALGRVSVEEVNGQLQATIPTLMITSPDKSTWQIPSITMVGSTSSDTVTITLPSTITRYNAAKAPIATMKLGQQSLNGRWNHAGNYFNSLNGNIKTITFEDTIAKSLSRVANAAITANKASDIQLTASDINTSMNKNGKTLNSAIGRMNIAYRLPEANGLTLTGVIGLFNPSILLSEGRKVGITVTAEQASATDENSRTTTIEKVASDWNLEAKGTIIAATTKTQAFIVRQTPESVYSFALPQKLDLNASIANLPRQLVSFAPGMSFTMAKEELAKAGTTINLSKLTLTTFDQGVIEGNGSVKANSTVPSGFVGRVTLKIKDLKGMISTSQMQLLQPQQGVNRAAKTQSVMALMLLQSMGKQNGNDTEFVLDLTPEGQTMVNGQDFSGLLSGLKGGKAMPSLPVTPVKGSDL